MHVLRRSNDSIFLAERFPLPQHMAWKAWLYGFKILIIILIRMVITAITPWIAFLSYLSYGIKLLGSAANPGIIKWIAWSSFKQREHSPMKRRGVRNHRGNRYITG